MKAAESIPTTDVEAIRVAVLGAGAVGCFFGGMLARAGHRVTLIGRPVHVEAFRKNGLRFEGLKFDERVAVEASTEAGAVRGARLVLFCVKSTDTEQAAAQIAPFLDADSIVVNLQNGVDNAERIQAHFSKVHVSRPVIPAVVYVATEMAGPGHLKHHGRGDLVIGAPDGDISRNVLEATKNLFEAAGVPVAISDNIAGELWAKLVVNCAYNAISAITQLPYGKMIAGAGVRDTMREVVEETLAVAKASGVEMAPDMLERTYRIAEAMPTQFSSTAQDLARGKPTEIDHLNGFVVRRGEASGVSTPANRALHALVRLLESKSRAKD
jgi:2-dehydropantoate 2-reductase